MIPFITRYITYNERKWPGLQDQEVEKTPIVCSSQKVQRENQSIFWDGLSAIETTMVSENIYIYIYIHM